MKEQLEFFLIDKNNIFFNNLSNKFNALFKLIEHFDHINFFMNFLLKEI